jgi:hypothetical protein
MKYVPAFLLLLGSWLQPLHLLPWVSWHSEMLAFAALAWLGAQLIWEMLQAGERHWTVPLAACLPMALAIYAMVQFGTGQIEFFGDALMVALYLVACGMAILIGYQWGASKPGGTDLAAPADDLLDALAVTVLLGATVSVCIMLVQAFDVWNATDWIVRTETYRRPGGNVGQPNHMATLMLMGMVSLLWLRETARLGLAPTWLLQVLLILGLAMTESRTGLLGAAVLTAWWYARRAILVQARPILPVVLTWGLLLLCAWLWPLFITSWHGMGESAYVRLTANVGVRSVVWEQLLHAAFQHPWAGWGLREVSKAHNAVLHLYSSGAPFTYTHNLVLDLVLGVGFPLAMLILTLCTLWFWTRARHARTLPAWYAIALGLPLAVHSMLEYPHAYAYLLIPVLLALGRMEAATGARAVMKIPLAYVSVAAGSLFLVTALATLEYVRIEEDFRVARFEALRVGQSPEQYEVPDSLLLTQLDAMSKATRMRPAPGMKPEDIDLLRRAAMRFPWTAIQNRYALSLALNGNPDEAIRQLRVIRAMHGEKHYEEIRAHWELLSQEKQPLLRSLTLP